MSNLVQLMNTKIWTSYIQLLYNKTIKYIYGEYIKKIYHISQWVYGYIHRFTEHTSYKRHKF